MVRLIRSRHGQTSGEYAILLTTVLGVIVGVMTYVGRGVKAKVKTGTDAFTAITDTITVGGKSAFIDNKLTQYEPYYLESSGQTYQENVRQKHYGSGKEQEEIVSDTTARAAGSYQTQVGVKNKAAKEKVFTEGP